MTKDSEYQSQVEVGVSAAAADDDNDEWFLVDSDPPSSVVSSPVQKHVDLSHRL